ncbi:photosystem II CP47 reaction center protein-like [Gossypium arboreum]|uniref:photosystem II CP47 reaction center protein-like n=1 Tax=Gossypium arboreum TaxID=29729 RepID=UPI0022F1593F|nr:photosystem II CP47 reaction center protein-like [Gossypium arboreum]
MGRLEYYRGDYNKSGYLSYEGVVGAHIVFSACASWRLSALGAACFGFGAFHVTGLYGLGIWVSDPYGLTGKVQPINPAWGVEGFETKSAFLSQ